MVFEKVKKVFVDTINCTEDEVELDKRLSEDLDIDSLDAVEIGMALESAFDIEIPDEELAKFETVKDVVDYIESQIN
ncbi:MAG: acyl carrier protein [Butyrivibrio sp.]